MRIRIHQKSPSSQLRVIPLIPSNRVGLLEGPNGIGKSLAVQLLDLVTGGQPWDNKLLWTSLRDALESIDAEISVSGLRSGHSLNAKLTPSEWPDMPPAAGDESIAEIEIDGETSSVAAAGDLLRVVRFSGTEDLREVARQEVSREALKFRLLERDVVPRFEKLQDQSGVVAEILRDANPAERQMVESRISEADSEAKKYEGELKNLTQERDEVGHALELSKALEGSEEIPADAEEELASLGTTIKEKESEVASTGKDLEAVLKSLAKGGDAESLLEKVENTHRARRKTRDSRVESLVELQERLAIEGDLTAETIGNLEKTAKEDLRRLQADRRGLGAGTRMLTVIDEISPPLDAVIDEGLGDQVLLRLEGGDLTATDLRAALRSRERDIAESKPSVRAAELDEGMASAERRIRELRDLRKAFEGVRRAEDNLEETEKDLVAARDALGKAKGDLERYDALTRRRDTATDEIRSAAEREVALRQSIGLPRHRSRNDMERELDAVLRPRSLERSNLLFRFKELEQEVEELRRSLDECRKQLDSAKRERDQANSRVRFAMRQIHDDPQLVSVLKAMEGLTRGGSTESEALEQLAVRARSVTDALGTGVTSLESIRVHLDEVSEERTPPGGSGSRDLLSSAIYSVLNSRLRSRLSAVPIRQALFDGQSLETVDLQDRTVTWGTNGGKTTRPIESFSTGEQAFAFTQARVLALEELPEEKDRLLVLDEFGAFVAADRRGELAKFLNTTPVRSRATQVLVVLPLRVNYDEEIGETRGKLRQLYERRIDQLGKDGYIAEPFKAEGPGH